MNLDLNCTTTIARTATWSFIPSRTATSVGGNNWSLSRPKRSNPCSSSCPPDATPSALFSLLAPAPPLPPPLLPALLLLCCWRRTLACSEKEQSPPSMSIACRARGQAPPHFILEGGESSTEIRRDMEDMDVWRVVVAVALVALVALVVVETGIRSGAWTNRVPVPVPVVALVLVLVLVTEVLPLLLLLLMLLFMMIAVLRLRSVTLVSMTSCDVTWLTPPLCANAPPPPLPLPREWDWDCTTCAVCMCGSQSCCRQARGQWQPFTYTSLQCDAKRG